jgi:hypothetical protein
MKRRLTLILLLAGTIHANAQEENSKNVTGQNKGYSLLYGGIETSTITSINTDTKDSNSVGLYLSPYIDYCHKSGFGVKVKSYALAGGSNPGFYLTSMSPYFAMYNGKVLPYISYSRYIQHDNLSVPYSPIQNELYAHLRIKTKYIEPWAGIDIGFGNDEQNNNASVSDFNAFAGVAHLFKKENIGVNKNNAFAMRPSLQLNAGTDRYYKFLRTSGYISKNTKAGRIGYGRGRENNNQGGSSTTGTSTYTISEENDFTISNLEANLYVMYFFGKFSIEPSGSLYFPLRGDDRTPYGYWQINLNYWLK